MERDFRYSDRSIISIVVKNVYLFVEELFHDSEFTERGFRVENPFMMLNRIVVFR